MIKLGIFWILLWAVAIIGWIANIVKFCQCDFKEPYKAEIIRGIGIAAAPLGAVIGYIHIKDK